MCLLAKVGWPAKFRCFKIVEGRGGGWWALLSQCIYLFITSYSCTDVLYEDKVCGGTRQWIYSIFL